MNRRQLWALFIGVISLHLTSIGFAQDRVNPNDQNLGEVEKLRQFLIKSSAELPFVSSTVTRLSNDDKLHHSDVQAIYQNQLDFFNELTDQKRFLQLDPANPHNATLKANRETISFFFNFTEDALKKVASSRESFDANLEILGDYLYHLRLVESEATSALKKIPDESDTSLRKSLLKKFQKTARSSIAQTQSFIGRLLLNEARVLAYGYYNNPAYGHSKSGTPLLHPFMSLNGDFINEHSSRPPMFDPWIHPVLPITEEYLEMVALDRTPGRSLGKVFGARVDHDTLVAIALSELLRVIDNRQTQLSASNLDRPFDLARYQALSVKKLFGSNIKKNPKLYVFKHVPDRFVEMRSLLQTMDVALLRGFQGLASEIDTRLTKAGITFNNKAFKPLETSFSTYRVIRNAAGSDFAILADHKNIPALATKWSLQKDTPEHLRSFDQLFSYLLERGFVSSTEPGSSQAGEAIFPGLEHLKKSTHTKKLLVGPFEGGVDSVRLPIAGLEVLSVQHKKFRDAIGPDWRTLELPQFSHDLPNVLTLMHDHRYLGNPRQREFHRGVNLVAYLIAAASEDACKAALGKRN